MSIRWRIALFGAGVVALAVFLFGLLLYLLVSVGLHLQRDRTLVRRAEQAAASLQLAGPVAFQPRPPLAPVDLSETSDSFVEVLDSSGQFISTTAVLDGAPPSIDAAVLRRARVNGHALATIEPRPGASLRVSVRPWARPDLGLQGYVIAGQADRVIRAQLQGLRTFLFLAALLSMVAALTALWLVSGPSLRPLKRMAQTADEIGQTEDLSRRLEGVRTNDEVGLLTASFNRMLARIEDAQGRLAHALEGQRRLVADASHELRSPLTSIRSNAGFLLRRPDGSPEDRQAAIEDIAAESERMSRLVQDLLTLARADAGQHLERRTLDLPSLVADVCRQARALHPARTIELQSPPALSVDGNDDALRELCWILLDNAVKHTQDGGRICMHLAATEAFAELRIVDDGPGIAEADRERIFERFVQADAARGDGAGLGLAIAAWIVGEHGGTIAASNHEPHGADFTVTISLPSLIKSLDAP